MAFTTKIHCSFWSDEDVGRLAADQKLAVLWLWTTKDMNNVGYLRVSRRQFEFDTGATTKALEGALKGLPRAFMFEESEGGLRVLALNFIRYQFGDQTLTEKNHVTKHLCGLLKELPEAFREALLERYKTLARAFQNLRVLQAPYKGDARDQSRAVQSRAEQSNREGSGEGSGPGADAKNGDENFGGGFHVEQRSALRYDVAEEILQRLNELAGTAFLTTPGNLHEVASRLASVDGDADGVKRMVARQVKLWKGDPKMRGYLRPATLFGEKFGDYYGQRDLPADETGTEVRAKTLRGLIEQSPANRESVYHSSQATPEDKEQLKQWRRELRGLEAVP